MVVTPKFEVEVKGNEPPPAPVASVPQTIFPLESVSSASVQEVSVETLSPPPVTESPALMVEVASPLRTTEEVPTLSNPLTLKSFRMVEVPVWKLATPLIERTEPGVEVPIPKNPFDERRMDSMRVPLLRVENARSPLAAPSALVVGCVSTPVIAAVVVE